MHLMVFHELNRMRVQNNPEIVSIAPEKSVLMAKNGVEREGKFDFLVQTSQKDIGVEILTRPSQGKMKEKLAYAREVDEFIFVLPNDSMGLYQKKKKNGLKSIVSKKFLEAMFSNPKLKVWLLDYRKGILKKGLFETVFNVKRQS